MRLLQTLRGRILGASLLVAALLGIVFAVLLLAVRDAREAARAAERSERVATTATNLERLLLDLETGQRAYVITGQRRFLDTWEAALRTYPGVAAELRSLVRDPAQRRRVDALERDIDAYVRSWARLVVRTVSVDQGQAARLVGTGEGKRRVDALRRDFDVFLRRQRQLSDVRHEQAEASGRRAVALGLGGLTASLLIVLAFAAYLVRSTIVPVERVTQAARRLREGDRTARVEERAGLDEAAALTRDFNAMATALADSFDEVARQRAELRSVLDAAVEGIAMAGPDGRFVYANERMDAFRRELALDGDGSLVGLLASLAASTGAPELYEESLARLAADPEAFAVEPFERADEERRSFVAYVGPVRGPDGSVVGRILSLRETTVELAAERAKEQFLSTVSHELRTPLTSIVGFTELVRHGEVGDLTRDQDRYLTIVERSARQLHSLVDDLLTVGQAGEGRLDLELEDVDLAEIAADAVEAARLAAEEKKIALELDADSSVPLRADARRLAQLVANLVTNAIKFTREHGHVGVRVSREGGLAVLEVSDDGVGIPAGEQAHVFERFFRASTAQRVPGTGLGLVISREIAEAHGGTIAVASSEGAGTTFRVELPA